jgi:hypothetical protein
MTIEIRGPERYVRAISHSNISIYDPIEIGDLDRVI